jgi:DNA (cytosine-5)-methyltransferase 1
MQPAAPTPSNEQEALQWLLPVLDVPKDEIPDNAFKRAWCAIFYLYGGLNPDDAGDHGTELIAVDDGPERFRDVEPRLIAPRYRMSGWPVVLAPLADEAWLRHESGRLSENELYCVAALQAGLLDRSNAVEGVGGRG